MQKFIAAKCNLGSSAIIGYMHFGEVFTVYRYHGNRQWRNAAHRLLSGGPR